MGERQRRQHDIARHQPHHGPRPRFIGRAERGMRQHSPLRLPRRPRRVEHKRRARGPHAVPHRLLLPHLLHHERGVEMLQDLPPFLPGEQRVDRADNGANLERAPDRSDELPPIRKLERDRVSRPHTLSRQPTRHAPPPKLDLPPTQRAVVPKNRRPLPPPPRPPPEPPPQILPPYPPPPTTKNNAP